MNETLKNKLVQYQGGGYSGCFWEWNFCYFDEEGVFHNVWASGRNGIETLEHWQNYDQSRWEKDKTYFEYDPRTEAAWKEISENCAKPHVLGLLSWFTNHTQLDVFAYCDDCGNWIRDPEDLSLEDWHGCGGIEQTADTLICYECRACNTCEMCEEYVGPDNLCVVKDVAGPDVQEELGEYVEVACTWCIEAAKDAVEQRKQEDTLWSALTTGVPDLFGPALAWYWDN